MASCANKNDIPAQPVGVRELVLGGDRSGQLVQVRGCMKSAFEQFSLMPCEKDAPMDYHVWVYDLEYIAAIAKVAIGVDFVKGDLEEANRASIHLNEITKNAPGLVPVVLYGEFQKKREGYGHLGAYPSSFILHRVISPEPRTD
jgi:hypothetical protein